MIIARKIDLERQGKMTFYLYLLALVPGFGVGKAIEVVVVGGVVVVVVVVIRSAGECMTEK